jgi:hypothetical protein
MNDENFQFLSIMVMEEMKPALVRSILNRKLDETYEALKANPAFYIANGTFHASWNYCDDFQHWNMTPEEEAEYDRRRAVVSDCLALIYRHNRLSSMLAQF